MKKLFVGSDHAGIQLKKFVKKYVASKYSHVDVVDVGTYDENSCHYPDFAHKLAVEIGIKDRGIVTCGSGIGIGIAVNKSGINCSTAFNEYTAK